MRRCTCAVAATLKLLSWCVIVSGLSGCFITKEALFTEANSIAVSESAQFQEFLNSASNMIDGQWYQEVPLGDPPENLRIWPVAVAGLLLVQESLEDLGTCETEGCVVFYGLRISEDETADVCSVDLEKLPDLVGLAERKGVQVSAWEEKGQPMAYFISGASANVLDFVLERFSEGPFNCRPAIARTEDWSDPLEALEQ